MAPPSSAAYLKELQQNWDVLGRRDPFRATIALFYRSKWSEDDFWALGKKEIDWLIKQAESLDVDIKGGRALDFGCGAGRMTQALAGHFRETHGVDIAPSMIRLARKLNRHGDRCRYHLNETDDLKLFSSNMFSLVYSTITLQHIKPECAKKYIREFIRVLAPRGLLVFQLPSERCADQRPGEEGRELKETVKKALPGFVLTLYCKLGCLWKWGTFKAPRMDSYYIPKEEVVQLLKDSRASIIDIWANPTQYCVTKE